MFDAQKIDSFFEGKAEINRTNGDKKNGKPFMYRLIKLGFPCLAALLLGIMVVAPNIKKKVKFSDTVTLPKKSEIEKLHIEESVINSTDAKNRVSTVWADSVDEVAPGADELKMVNPRAKIQTDDGIVDVASDEGFLNRSSNILKLVSNVKAINEKNTVVTTSEVFYDFPNDHGYGTVEINATGDWGIMKAQGFDFYKDTSVLVLNGKNQIITPKGDLSSEGKTVLFQSENKLESYDKVFLKQADNQAISADMLVAYFSDGKSKEIKTADAYGNVKILYSGNTATGEKAHYNALNGTVELQKNVEINTQSGKAYANRAVYYTDTQNAELYGNVVIKTQKGKATGNKGIYNAQKQEVDLMGDVTIEQNGNFIKGAHAHTDMKTSISTIVADKTNNGRIFGTFYNKRKDKDEGSTKK